MAPTCRLDGRATRTPSPSPSPPCWASGPDRSAAVEQEVERLRRHEDLEVEILRFLPASLPFGPVALPFAFQETFPPRGAGEPEERQQGEEVGQLGPRAVGAFE